MKKTLKNELGITLIALVLIIIMVLAIAYSTIYYIFFVRTEKTIEGEKIAETLQNTQKTLIENEIDIRIVSDLVDNKVPIPKGYIHYEGNIQQGLIIEAVEIGTKYLFIPYNEQANTKVNDYFKNVSYIEIDSTVLTSIKKYGGFFVALNTNFKIEDLKEIKNNKYVKLQKQLENTVEEIDTVNSHIVSDIEIAQIEYYLKNNNIDIGDNTIGIQALTIELFSQINEEELISTSEIKNTQNIGSINGSLKISKTSNLNIEKVSNVIIPNEEDLYYCNYPTTSKLYGASKDNTVNIPIPCGFNYCSITDGPVLIQDKESKNLIYVWVPMPSEFKDIYKNDYKDFKKSKHSIKEQIIDIYKEFYTLEVLEEIKKYINESEEDLDSKFIKSIEKYNGFYISIAELSFDGDNYINLGRGMIDNSVVNLNKNTDYFRTNNIGKTENNAIYKEMSRIAYNSNAQNSVVAHILYGMEYDTTLLWISSTSDNKDINNILFKNSIEYGKYFDSGYSETSSAIDFETFNEIWGLGGNLAELTQEKYGAKYVTRGGSWNTSGKDTPIASRATFSDLNTQKGIIGMRTALYIDPNISTELSFEGKIPYFKYEPNDDVKVDVSGTEFIDLSDEEEIKYICNLDGAVAFYDIKNTKNSETLAMGEKVTVTKESVSTVSIDGAERYLSEVKINGKTLYVKSGDLTSKLTTYETNSGSKIEFVMANTWKNKYYNKSIAIHSTPDENDIEFYTNIVGAVCAIAQSTDGKWYAYQDANGIVRFILVEDVKGVKTASPDFSYGFVWVNGYNLNYYVAEDGVNMYKTPEENNSIKTLNKNTNVVIKSLSTDTKWAAVTVDSENGYVLLEKLTPNKEPEIAPTTPTFVDVNENVWVKGNGVRIRTSYDTSTNDNIYKKCNYAEKLTRTGTSDYWSRVEIDGTPYYIASQYLSTTELIVPPPVTNTTMYVTCSYKRLRSSVDNVTNNVDECVGLALKGESVIVNEKTTDEIFKVTLNTGETGYMHSDNLSETPGQPTYKLKKVTANWKRCWKTFTGAVEGKDDNVLDTISEDGKVQIIGEALSGILAGQLSSATNYNQKIYKVKYGDKYGYMVNNNLETIYMYYSNSYGGWGLNNESGGCIGLILHGDKVEVLETSNPDSYKVKIVSTGEIGFVPTDYLSDSVVNANTGRVYWVKNANKRVWETMAGAVKGENNHITIINKDTSVTGFFYAIMVNSEYEGATNYNKVIIKVKNNNKYGYMVFDGNLTP